MTDTVVTEGEAKDRILEYSLTKFEQHIHAAEIQEEVFPDLTEHEVKFLIEKIDRNSSDIAEIGINEYNCLIKSNPITKRFLENGGFTKLEKDKAIRLAREKEIEEIEFKKSKIDLELAEQMLEEYPKTKRFARIGAFIGIGLALLELIKWIMKLQSQ